MTRLCREPSRGRRPVRRGSAFQRAGAVRGALALLFALWLPVPPAEAALQSLSAGHRKPVTQFVPLGPLASSRELNLAIGLRGRNEAELDRFLHELYTPGSPHYRRFLSAAEFSERFGPSPAQRERARAYVRAHGLALRPAASGLVIEARGRVADIERAFHVRLRKYRHPVDRRDFFAPDGEPAVEEDVPIRDVQGLDDFSRPKPRLTVRAADESFRTPRSGSAAQGSYGGVDFRAAYVPGVSLTGRGQSLAQVQFDGFYSEDIAQYAATFGIPLVPVETVLVDGYDGVPTPGLNNYNAEVSLDLELAMAMAPGLDKIIVYSGGPYGSPNAVLSRIADENRARQVSCSWGWSGGPDATTELIFKQMAAQGQSFFTASGDEGAYSATALDDPEQANAPASSPNITVVGGTTLTTSGPGGARLDETVWNRGQSGASGGGVSSVYELPEWQDAFAMTAAGGSATRRNIPDVALLADDAWVIYNQGSGAAFSGTSLAAPLWAGLAALVNEQAGLYGLPPVGFLNPALYALGHGLDYNAVFHDIVTGGNTNRFSPGSFFAREGFDLCTGWGTPNGTELIQHLAQPPDSLVVWPAAGLSWRGVAGGPFSPGAGQFALTNTGDQSLVWTAGISADWAVLSAAAGTLAPRSSEGLMIQLSSPVEALAPGEYTSALGVTNLLTGVAQTRRIDLRVAAQMVEHGGFESNSFAGWVLTGNSAYCSVVASRAYVHSGARGAKLGPSGSLAYLAQDLDTTPGGYYLLSCWLATPHTGSPNQFQIEWDDGLVWLQTNMTQTSWTNVQLVLRASRISTPLRFGFRHDPGYFALDDVLVIPAPMATVLPPENSADQARFSWRTTPGIHYQLEITTNLAQPWSAGPAFAATNSAWVLSDGNPRLDQQFFRLRLRP